MTALQTPQADAPAKEWGRLAVSIPGWRWMPGMIDTYPSFRLVVDYDPELDDLSDSVPDPNDPATAGCLWELAGRPEVMIERGGERVRIWDGSPQSIARPTAAG